MDYLRLLECGYAEARENLGHIIENRFEYLGEMIFDFTTYDGDMAALFAVKALEVCKAITYGKTYEYINENEDNHRWFLIMCNMPFFKNKLSWGGSIRGAWWEYEITFGCMGLWDGDKQIDQELFFKKTGWEQFMLALFQFASIEEVEEKNEN